MKAVNLKTEYLENPLGIDIVNPRFFWNCIDGVTQTAYQIIVIKDNGNELWDSGKVISNKMTHIEYSGHSLNSRDRILWKVRLWDENDIASHWSEANFEIGLLNASDWAAKWITGNYSVKKSNRYPVDYFKKTVSINKPVHKARLYITACGLYEAHINNLRVGNFVLAPGVTDYNKRIHYQTYDVTELLVIGVNSIVIQLANGWYRGSVGAWGKICEYGTETKFLSQLEAEYEDGTIEFIVSDNTWVWSNDGPIRFADNKDGEIIEAFREPSFSGKAKITTHKIVPISANSNFITEHERFNAKIVKTSGTSAVLDFGQNIAGYIEFSLAAKEGQKIFIRFGEMLNSAGEFTQKNFQLARKKKTTPLQQIIYFCRNGVNHYKTKFAIFGFQYVLLESDAEFTENDFTAVAVYSDIKKTFNFECSSPLLNKFVQNTYWSLRGNSADVLTDCPQRERHAWTGDAQIFSGTASFMLDFAPFARKYISDMCDAQRRDGAFLQISPKGGTDFYMKYMDGSAGWADAGVIIPYLIWKHYGDERIIKENYSSMKRYASFLIKRCGKRSLFSRSLKINKKYKRFIVNCGQHYGEWAEPEDVHHTSWQDLVFSNPETATAYASNTFHLMREIAGKLGKEKDSRLFGRFADNTKTAYSALRNSASCPLNTDRMAMLVRPLYFGLLDNEQKQTAQKLLIKSLDDYNWRIGTGFLSTPFILYALDEINIEHAYKLLENEEMPGWLYMVKCGANTIWEAWEGINSAKGIASLNHYSKGAVCEWIFKVMCGINIIAENHFTIAPRPGGNFLNAKMEYDSIYGKVCCKWEKQQDGAYIYIITVPSNCTANVILPVTKCHIQNAGTKIYADPP